MIFQHTWEQVLDGSKTQTRRIVNKRHWMVEGDTAKVIYRENLRAAKTEYPVYAVGKTYAVCPGRGKKSVGRVRITDIRRERLQDISEEDAIAEGIDPDREFNSCYSSLEPLRAEYSSLWNTIHTRKGERWADNPLVWVLIFELVEAI